MTSPTLVVVKHLDHPRANRYRKLRKPVPSSVPRCTAPGILIPALIPQITADSASRARDESERSAAKTRLEFGTLRAKAAKLEVRELPAGCALGSQASFTENDVSVIVPWSVYY